METNRKKAVIIIEDDIIAYRAIRDIISADYPNKRQKYNDDDDLNNFCKIIQNALSGENTEKDEPEKSKKLLLKKLKSYCGKNEEPVYLIDFLLDHEKYHPSINGQHFYKFIHNELYKDRLVPSLFITAAEGTDLSRVQDHCEEEINDKQICRFRPKPDKWNDVDFEKYIINFIKNAQSKPKTEQKNEHKKLEDVIELN